MSALIGFAPIALALVVLLLVGWVSSGIAKDKGYNGTEWGLACFLAAPLAILLLIALPNKKQHEELLQAICELQESLGQAGLTGKSGKPSNELPLL